MLCCAYVLIMRQWNYLWFGSACEKTVYVNEAAKAGWRMVDLRGPKRQAAAATKVVSFKSCDNRTLYYVNTKNTTELMEPRKC